MLEHRTTVTPTITPEFDQACDTYNERLEWMLDNGWLDEWVAISGTEILDHGTSKRHLAMAYENLYQEKKLLLRKVLPRDFDDEYHLW